VTFGSSAPVEFSGDVKIKCVCYECNHGWMSDLENRIKPNVSGMVHDLSVSLTIEDQRGIALWAVKTAMVLQGAIAQGRTRFYTTQECEQLRVSSLIPERTLIWVGRLSESALFAAGTHIWQQDNLGVTHSGHAATFIVGYLIFQVLSIRVGPQYYGKAARTVCRDGPWDDSLFGIYPPNQTVESVYETGLLPQP